MDFADSVTARLPLTVVVVVGLSALLLMVVSRSLLIPVKAALLNPVSLGAALSAITLVFQHGLMHLFGAWAWRLSAWPDRRLPRVAPEHAAPRDPLAPAATTRRATA